MLVHTLAMSQCHDFGGMSITVSILAMYQCLHMAWAHLFSCKPRSSMLCGNAEKSLCNHVRPSDSKWWLRLACFYDCWVLAPQHDICGYASLHICHACLRSTIWYSRHACFYECSVPEPQHGGAHLLTHKPFPRTATEQCRCACLHHALSLYRHVSGKHSCLNA